MMNWRGAIKRVLKWSAIAVTTVIVIIIAAVGLCVWVLTPARLTPIVRDVASEAVPGVEVGLARAELTFWSTFPRLYIDLDSLSLADRAFPLADDRTVIRLGHLHGGVDIPALLTGAYRVYDVELSGLSVNVVVLDDTRSNLSGLVPADTTATPSETPLILPEFSINRFEIKDSLVMNYRHKADSLYMNLTVRPSRVLSGTDDGYDVDLRSNVTYGPVRPLNIESVPMAINGRVVWSPQSPFRLALRDFGIDIAGVPVRFDTALDFADTLRVETADIDLGPVVVDSLRQLLTDGAFPQLDDIVTDMKVQVKARLSRPYVLNPDTVLLPHVSGTIDIPDCSLSVGPLHYDGVGLAAGFDINGDDLDRSVVNVDRLAASGRVISASFSGKATRLLSDPSLDGKMMLLMVLDRLPGKLLDRYGMQASGRVALDASGRFRLSDLSRQHFYRADLKGSLSLDNLAVEMPDSGIAFYTGKTVLGLGTHTSYKGATNRVDSLLMASVTIDTLALDYGDIRLTVADVKGGFGCENRPPSADTTIVVPLGAGLKVGRLLVTSGDSVRMGLRGGSVQGRILRYEGDSKVPQLSLSASADVMTGTDGKAFVGLVDGSVSADAHLRRRRQRPDSLRQRSKRRRQMVVDTVNTVDFGAGGLATLVNRWSMTGQVRAGRGMMFTPLMPIRNRLTDLDMTFSTDSIVLHSLKYKGGGSDFSVKGTVSNLRRALNRRGDMVVRCTVSSDTLDLDQLLHIAAMGSAQTASTDASQLMTDFGGDTDLRQDTAIDTEAPLTAILVPTNIDADLDVTAGTVLYSQLPVSDFGGCLMVKGGAISLTDLHARSGRGSLDMSALYSAPSPSDIRFGLGLRLNDINVKEFIDLMPAVDSIMPLLGSFKGIIDADVAATADLDSLMTVRLPTLDAAVKLSGDSLTLLDAETFRTLKKWLRFKGTESNQIEHMDVEMLISDSNMEIFPFVFNFDRYRLAVMGTNDLDLNYNYHISVLKSPLPFKFGINISGNPDKMKVRLGGAKYKDGMAGQSVALVDTTRINLLDEMQRVFRSGAARREFARLNVNRDRTPATVGADEGISHADSILMIREGLIAAPDTVSPIPTPIKKK